MAGTSSAAGVSDPTVTVRVYNYAGVSGRVLQGAEKEASRVFTAAGIDVTWVDCTATPVLAASGSAQGEEGKPDCLVPVSGAGIVLRILSRSTPASKTFRDTMFGFAEGSFVASVFYARIEDLAHGAYGSQRETPVILGDVIAHEIGHLLLGTNSHSRAGIMCGKWDREYLRLVQEGFQIFSAEQSSVMRATVVRRNAQDALSAPVSIGSTSSSRPGMTLRVYNYAQVDPAVLARAREVATAIFGESGMEAVWVDCPISAAEFEKYPACHQRTETTHFVLRVMTASMAVKLPTSRHPLGFAHECRDDQPGCVANAFYARIAELARQSGTDPATILGHVMAHEIGHLLLGPNSDSSSGIMCGEWSLDDLRLMNWHYLLFTPGQSEQLRANLLRRSTLEAGLARNVFGVRDPRVTVRAFS